MKEVVVDVGNPVELLCHLDGEVLWSKLHGTINRDSKQEKNRLKIFSVSETDAGIYCCKVGGVERTLALVVTGIVPYFAQAPISYIQFLTLPDAYLEFQIQVSFRAESDGLIFFNGQDNLGNGDFIVLGLKDKFLEFRFNLGGGVARLVAEKPVKLGEWHTAVVWRNKKNVSLSVDNSDPVHGYSEGIFQGLDLVEPFFLGGLPTFFGINPNLGFKRGFVGCVSKIALGPRQRDITKSGAVSVGITGCETCAQNPCVNGGVCQESNSQTGFVCLCPLGFSGWNCSKVGDACHPGICGDGFCQDTPSGVHCSCPIGKTGPRCKESLKISKPAFTGDSFIAFPRPKHILRRLNVGMKFKVKDLKDSVLFYCSQSEDGKGDFASLTIKDGFLEFRFDTGSGAAVLKSSVVVRQDEWHSVKIKRKLREASMVLDDGVPVVGNAVGNTRGLNIKTPFYLGGVNLQKYSYAAGVGVQTGFTGCIIELELSGIQLDMVEDAIESGNITDCTSMSPCEVGPCKNGGLCTDLSSSTFSCACPPGYSGQLCGEEENMCQILAPCLNNGRCRGNVTQYVCDCTWGFAGTHCNKSVELGKEVGLKGNGYLELRRSLFPHNSTDAPEVMVLLFSTDKPNGLLLWQGQDELVGNGGDFLMLWIQDGYPSLSYELGGGPANLTLLERVDDGNLHKLEITRRGRKGDLVLDDKKRVSGSSQGVLQILNTGGNIYLGGGPDLNTLTAGRLALGFNGCLHSLSFGGTDVNFRQDSVSTANLQPCQKSSSRREEEYDTFYSSLLEDVDSDFDEDAYLERLQRVG